jgi:hypothetical protein
MAAALSDDSDDEWTEGVEVQINSALVSMLAQYSDPAGAQRARQLIEQAITSGCSVCLICLENIKFTSSVRTTLFIFVIIRMSRIKPLVALVQIWTCDQCSTGFHLPCIQQWIGSTEAQAILTDPSRAAARQTHPWHWCVSLRFYSIPSQDSLTDVPIVVEVPNVDLNTTHLESRNATYATVASYKVGDPELSHSAIAVIYSFCSQILHLTYGIFRIHAARRATSHSNRHAVTRAPCSATQVLSSISDNCCHCLISFDICLPVCCRFQMPAALHIKARAHLVLKLLQERRAIVAAQ